MKSILCIICQEKLHEDQIFLKMETILGIRWDSLKNANPRRKYREILLYARNEKERKKTLVKTTNHGKDFPSDYNNSLYKNKIRRKN